MLPLAAGLAFGAAALSAGLIVLLRPWMARYALARPNARSLHRIPTPQGGGAAVVLATLLAAFAGTALLGLPDPSWAKLGSLGAAVLGLAAIGGIDDVRPLPAAPRLLLQLACAALAVSTLPSDLRLFGPLPWLAERAVLVVGLAWFVNLTNFMDGMDWMTVAEMVPVAAGLVGFAAIGVLPPATGLLALALAGALIGFAPFNAPVARLFLGDVGSLPIGLMAGYGLVELALRGDFAAALLMPLYYLGDSGVTLLRRVLRGAPVWQAHREHAYQVAVARGLTVPQVLGRVFGVNLGLLALAAASHAAVPLAKAALVLAGAVLVFGLLRVLARGNPGRVA